MKRRAAESCPCSCFSMHDESLYALRALRAGALGCYVMKVEALTHVRCRGAKSSREKSYVSPEFSERLIFQAVQSVEGRNGLSGRQTLRP